MGYSLYMARPITTSYTDIEKTEIVKRLCGLIIQTSVEAACKEVGIAESTFYAWVASDSELAEEYARARKAIAYKDENEIEKLAVQAANQTIDPQAANVAINARKWLAGKRNALIYGDKLETKNEHSGPNGGPLQQQLAVDPQTIAEAMKLFKESL